MGVAVAIVNAILVILYPVAVWVGLSYLGTRAVSFIVLALVVPTLALRLRKADRATFWTVVRVPIAILVLVVLGAATDDPRFVLAMPVLVNLVLLFTFGETLRSGQMPIIERFARMQEKDLSEAKQAHCRRWTGIWCVFFVANAGTALALGLVAPLSWWATYTGGIAYGLMGLMFAGEYVLRKAKFRDDPPRSPLDRLMTRVFPPPAGALAERSRTGTDRSD